MPPTMVQLQTQAEKTVAAGQGVQFSVCNATCYTNAAGTVAAEKPHYHWRCVLPDRNPWGNPSNDGIETGWRTANYSTVQAKYPAIMAAL